MSNNRIRRGDRGLGRTAAGGNVGSYTQHDRAPAVAPTTAGSELAVLSQDQLTDLRCAIGEAGGMTAELNAEAREIRDAIDRVEGGPTDQIAFDAQRLADVLEDINSHPESIAVQAAAGRLLIRTGAIERLTDVDLWCVAADPSTDEQTRALVAQHDPDAARRAAQSPPRREAFAWEEIPDGVQAVITPW